MNWSGCMLARGWSAKWSVDHKLSAEGISKDSPGATQLPGVEDAVNPSLEASWRHPWRQDLHAWAVEWPRGGL
ncbi:hypothetical protein HH1059_05090 [Halorhodospira halochloris]|uniref:Uncharacterized protein n=1 Tax=Halorhodospira halochloris TaxID=1052 RepID=A0A2Z6EZH9_HALHR|nr:hypothetical protein HH1059_05090 [Halorhodospira halochloris]